MSVNTVSLGISAGNSRFLLQTSIGLQVRCFVLLRLLGDSHLCGSQLAEKEKPVEEPFYISVSTPESLASGTKHAVSVSI